MKPFFRFFLLFAFLFVVGAIAPRPANAVEIYVTYGDPAGKGFFDPAPLPDGRILGQARRSTFEAAVSYWKRKLGGNVPIEVRAVFSDLGGSAETGATLAFAGPTSTRENFTGALLRDTSYPIALANQMAGVDLAPPPGSLAIPSHEINATFNADIDKGVIGGLRWYYGVDGNPPILGLGEDNKPITDIDFFSTAMHELGHGLGFIALMGSDGSVPTDETQVDNDGDATEIPAAFARYMSNGITATSPRLIALTLERRAAALISDNLFFAGATARRGTGTGFNAKLFAPLVYQPGSSVSHLDEDSYSGINELMTPFYSEGINQAGPITLGIMADIGWNVTSLAPEPTPTAPPTPATPATIGRIVYSAGGDIWMMNSNGSEKTRLTVGAGNDFQPALSFQGDKVVFVSDRTGDTELYMLTVGSTDGPTRLTTSAGEDTEPSFRTDGAAIVFTSSRMGNRAVFVMTLGNRGVYPITNNQSSSYSPTFSFDGTRVAFVSTRDGNPEIYTIDARGNNLRRMTRDTAPNLFNDTEPTFNRVGSVIAFASDRAGNNEIYSIPANTGINPATNPATGTVATPDRLTRNVARDSAPRFSPYEPYLTFQSDLLGNSDIWIMPITGGVRYRLTTETSEDVAPYWGGGNGAPVPVATPTPTASATPTTPPTIMRPANNDFVNAQLIQGPSGNVAGNSTNANKVPGEPNHGGNVGGASIWYKWVAPRDGSVVFETTGSAFDTVMAVYRGTAINALTLIVQNDDASPTLTTSRVSFATTVGTTYYIAVDGFGGASGAVRLSWIMVNGPPNDNFLNATVISGAAGTINGSNVNATRQVGEANHAGNVGGKSIWYKWTAPSAGIVRFTTLGSGFDTLLEGTSGTAVSTLTVLAANDDASASTSTSAVSFNVAAGAVYHVVVDGFSGAMGAVKLNWNLVAAPPTARPDLSIRTANTAFVGENVYGTAGQNQQSSSFVARGQTMSYAIRIQNDGNVADSIKVQGSGRFFSVSTKYFDATGVDISADVVAGTYQTVRLAPGESRTIRLDVSFLSAANPGEKNIIDISGTSTAANVAVARDVVRAFTTENSNTLPRNSPVVVRLSSGAATAPSAIELRFMSALDAAAAGDATHYSVAVGGRAISVESASYSANTFAVRLTLPAGALRVGDEVAVGWQQLRDANGRLVADGAATLRAR